MSATVQFERKIRDTVLKQSVSKQLNWKEEKTAKYGKLKQYLGSGSGKNRLVIILIKKKKHYVQ